MNEENCGCMCHRHEDDLSHTVCVCEHCKQKPLKRNGVRGINLPALQRIVDTHLLPATIETMKPEDWKWIVQTIDKELTRARAEGAKARTMKHRKEFREIGIQTKCPKCNYPFTIKIFMKYKSSKMYEVLQVFLRDYMSGNKIEVVESTIETLVKEEMKFTLGRLLNSVDMSLDQEKSNIYFSTTDRLTKLKDEIINLIKTYEN